jgi:hypothetical protein
MSTYQLGPETPLGQLAEDQAKTSIPPNAVLSSFQLGKTARPGPRWINVGYKMVELDPGRNLTYDDEDSLPPIIAPDSFGGSAAIHVPEGAVVSSLALGAEKLFVWYRKILAPANFLGPEVQGMGTKEPENNGGGQRATEDGSTLTGFQWLKDPDGTLALQIWYRPVL